MRRPALTSVPVLVVGAGPAGLAAAATLARHGIETLVIERRLEPSRHPRATAVSTWSMELMRSWGLEPAVRGGSIEIDWHGLMGRTLMEPGSVIPLGYPTREQSAAVSPTGPACVPQDHLEPVLARHLQSLGGRIETGTELVGLKERGHGVDVVLADSGGAVRTVRAAYVIGADGAYSAVRSALGIAMRGPDVLVQAMSALFRAPLWDLLGERRYGLYPVTHPDAAGAFVPAGRGDRWLYAFMREPGTLDPADYGEAEMTSLIRTGAGVPDLEPRIDQVGAFASTAQIADSFRGGRVFLAGDAAHRVTPRGGTGMNTAIRDGYDLGWKLAWVWRGWAGQELLDSYEDERYPVAEHNVLRSADPNGSVRDVADELHVDLGGRIPHVWIGWERERLSTLDLIGPGLTLFLGPDATAVPPATPAPLVVRRLSATTARALGIGARGSLLVRPDGAPARAGADLALAR